MRRIAALLVVVAAVGCSRRKEVVVFHAASLRRAFADAAEELGRLDSKIRVRLEPSGSVTAARKLTELGMRADVVAVADASIIDRMLIPDQASWNIEFAAGEVVLAHLEHSRFTDEVSSETWAQVVTRPGVRLGRVNPATGPLGYRTLFVWQLCSGGDDLVPRLMDQCAPEHVVPDETALLSLLESRTIDYAFLYRSTAEDHHLKLVELPPECNLSHRHRSYAAATYRSGDTVHRGGPIVYGLTIPTKAPNPTGARRFVVHLLGGRGQRALRRAGFRVLTPGLARSADALPLELRPFVEALRPGPRHQPSSSPRGPRRGAVP